ncbi:MAG: hypothetical protein EOO14_05040 [Chitinophagaceae bacterium]|nr:MAG: hypothetical protein EOO14_05040 [Chitinophagaceae bacterium]
MKKQFLSVAIVAGLGLGIVACSNDSADTASNDTTSSATANVETTTTSTGAYAAMADSVERNSGQGYYLNPKTGQPYANLKVDRSSGRVSTEAGEPVWRYVDNRNWWVYSWDPATSNWNQTGEARMENNSLQYRDESDKWVDYDTRWKKDDGLFEDEMKKETENAKVKVEEDGDTKVKYEDGTKVKTDEEGTKIKTKDGKKIKMDKDGVKVDN